MRCFFVAGPKKGVAQKHILNTLVNISKNYKTVFHTFFTGLNATEPLINQIKILTDIFFEMVFLKRHFLVLSGLKELLHS